MDNNLYIYESSRVCPAEALKTIQAGKLKGKSDINPMWRIKQLTTLFGPCGVGWKTFDETFWTTPGANGEVIAWCSLKLSYWEEKLGWNDWSEPVFGIGGSMLVDTQKGVLTSNDEAYKMAYTDAISVACKALGFAADVYWEKDRTKYDRADDTPPVPPKEPTPPPPPKIDCERCGKKIAPMKNGGKVWTVEEIAENSKAKYNSCLCWNCMKEVNAQRAEMAQAGEGQ